MLCNDCGSGVDLQAVNVTDLSTNPISIDKWTFCTSCLRDKGFWCDKHGVHKIIRDSDIIELNNGDPSVCISTCLKCCGDEIARLSSEDVSRLYAILSSAISNETLTEIASNQPAKVFEDVRRNVLYIVLMTSQMNKMDLYEGIRNFAFQNN